MQHRRKVASTSFRFLRHFLNNLLNTFFSVNVSFMTHIFELFEKVEEPKIGGQCYVTFTLALSPWLLSCSCVYTPLVRSIELVECTSMVHHTRE